MERTEADALAEQVFEALLEEALVDVVQLVHRSRRLGFEPGGEDEAVGPPATAQPAHGADVWGQRHPPLASEEVCCPVCARLLSAGRFAPHLEKCTGKGRRAAGKTAPREPLYVPSWTPRVKRPKLAPPPGASAPPPAVAPASSAPYRASPLAAPAPVPSVQRSAPADSVEGGAPLPPPKQATAEDFLPCRAGAFRPPPAARLRDVHAWSCAADSPHAHLEAPHAPPAWAPPQRSAAAVRRDVRREVSASVTVSQLTAYAAAPPGPDTPNAELDAAARALRSGAAALREVEPAGAPGRALDDVAILLQHLCAVPSVRGPQVGRICGNALGCTNHRQVERDMLRSRLAAQPLQPAWGQVGTPPPPPPLPPQAPLRWFAEGGAAAAEEDVLVSRSPWLA